MELELNTLFLERFCGTEQYLVESATWYVIDGDGTEDDPDMLCIAIEFKHGTNLHDDTKTLNANPSWEINFYSLTPVIDLLKENQTFVQPNETEDIDGNLYYAAHQPTINNVMQILEVNGNKLKVKLSAETEDINYYDGSKPKNTLQLITWLEKQ